MAEQIIGWILLSISALGAIYAIGLIVTFFITPKDFNDLEFDAEPGCDCYRCERR